MIVVPRWFSAGIASAIAAYTAAFAILWIATGRSPLTNLVALGFFGLALRARHRPHRPDVAADDARVVGSGLAAAPARLGRARPGARQLQQRRLVRQRRLLPRRRAALAPSAVAAWILLGCLMLHTFAWGGFDALNGFGVVAAALLIAIMAAGGWAVARTEHHLSSFSVAEREALEWEAAQDAYQAERQVRLATTSRLASGMLHRIAAATRRAHRRGPPRVPGARADDPRRDPRPPPAERRGARAGHGAPPPRRPRAGERRRRHRRPAARACSSRCSRRSSTAIARAAVRPHHHPDRAAGLRQGRHRRRDVDRPGRRGARRDDDDEEQVDLWLELDRPVLA